MALEKLSEERVIRRNLPVGDFSFLLRLSGKSVSAVILVMLAFDTLLYYNKLLMKLEINFLLSYGP